MTYKLCGRYDVLGSEDHPVTMEGGDGTPVGLGGGCDRVDAWVDQLADGESGVGWLVGLSYHM